MKNTGPVAERSPCDWEVLGSILRQGHTENATSRQHRLLDKCKGLSGRAANIINDPISYIQINSVCLVVATHEGNSRKEKKNKQKRQAPLNNVANCG